MKLDFFDRLFGKEKKEKSFLIDSSGLRGWLETQIESRKKEIHRECSSLIDAVFADLTEIKKEVIDLGKKECPAEIPKRARKIVLTSKPGFVHGILDTLASMDDKKPSDYGGLERFNENLESAVSSLGKIGISQGRYLPIAFGEEIDGIRVKSKKLFQRSRELKGVIGSEVVLLSRALEELVELESKLKELEELNSERSNLKGNLEKFPEKRSVLDGKTESLGKSREFGELKRAEKELEGAREQLNSYEMRIYGHIVPLKKYMKKFRKSAESKGINPVILKDIDTYLQNPVDSFLSDKTGRLENILGEMRKSIEGGDLKLKDMVKALARIESALKVDSKKLGEGHMELKALERDLTEKINSFSIAERRKKLERDIEHLDREKETLEDELDVTDKKINNIKEYITDKRGVLERKLNELEGYKIEIDWKD
jgi:predicted  nucleic acid-binding Zn-ribbon protein